MLVLSPWERPLGAASPSGPLHCVAGRLTDLGPPLSRGGLCVRPVSFRASGVVLGALGGITGTPPQSWYCRSAPAAWRGLRYAHQAWTGCWSMALGAALCG